MRSFTITQARDGGFFVRDRAMIQVELRGLPEPMIVFCGSLDECVKYVTGELSKSEDPAADYARAS